MDARTAAVRILHRVLGEGRSLTDALEGAGPLPPSEQGLSRELAYGVLRWHRRLEHIARRLLAHPLKRKDLDVQILLLVGLYQVFELGTAPHAAVSATAEVARTLGKPWAVGLTNAILRRAVRERDALITGLPADPGVRHAYPEWMVRRLRAAWPDRWEALLAAGNARGPMTLRVNRLRTDSESYRQMLGQSGLAAEPLGFAPDALMLAEPVAVERLPGFREGLVSVQDAAAQQAAVLLSPPPGARVLDACAAPGGKTCHLLERHPELAEVVALDVEPGRLGRLEASLERLGLAATVRAGDAADPSQWWDGRPFQRILIDAPCSGSGVIRRHPDIKWLRRESDLQALAAGQRRLLEGLWPLLESGGKLVYSTCSVFPQENEEILAAFLAGHADARAVPVTTAGWGAAQRLGCQILTGEQGMDGFYYGCLSKL